MSVPENDPYHEIDDPELAPEAVPTASPESLVAGGDDDDEDDDEPSIGVDPDISN